MCVDVGLQLAVLFKRGVLVLVLVFGGGGVIVFSGGYLLTLLSVCVFFPNNFVTVPGS